MNIHETKLSDTTPPSGREPMSRALRGLNLGSWLVTERWMAPQVFDDVRGEAEIDVVRELGMDIASQRLDTHRRTFITEADFRYIAQQGFDFVRLPVGYWLFEVTPDFVDGETYLKKAFHWAQRHHLGVVLDFHGLQGSQNGWDHSGQTGDIRLYKDGNVPKALKTLEYMAKTYGHEPSLLAIEIINEPKIDRFYGKLLDYYERGYEIVARYTPDTVKIIVSDAFNPLGMAKKLSRRHFGSRLVLDVHLYQVFSAQDQSQSFDQHIDKVYREWQPLLLELSNYVQVMVGEWSAALPAATYDDGCGPEEGRVARYYRSQCEMFSEYAWAHAYWSYRAPGCGVWSWRDACATLIR